MKKLSRPTKSGIPFNMSVLKAREVDRFINKAHSKSSPGNDGLNYKVYKKCPQVRYILFLLLR